MAGSSTRSAGQQSRGFGRIEDLFAGGHLETPRGPLDLPPYPGLGRRPRPPRDRPGLGGAARDPHRRHRPGERDPEPRTVQRLPRARLGARPATWHDGSPRSGLPLSMVRVSTPLETATTFALGRRRAGEPASSRRYLGVPRDGCRALPRHRRADRASRGSSGRRRGRSTTWSAARRGIAGPGIGSAWRHGRFAAPYLRNALWDAGYAVDTLETATDWTDTPRDLAAALGRTLRHGLEAVGERVHAFSHLSHAYPSGSSLYTTYVFRLAADPDETLERWRTLKTAASARHRRARRRPSATSTASAPTTRRTSRPRRARSGWRRSRPLVRTFDPDGRMARGVLLEDGAP